MGRVTVFKRVTWLFQLKYLTFMEQIAMIVQFMKKFVDIGIKKSVGTLKKNGTQ